MELFFELLRIAVLGVSYGLILFLIATGMSLTLGLMRVVNMSHGAIYMFAGYTGVWLYTQIRGLMPNLLAWLVAIVVAALVGAALGAILEIGFLRRLYKYPTYQVLLTIGIINILNNVTEWIWGGLPMTPPTPDFLRGGIPIGGVNVPYIRFFVLAVGAVMALLLWLLQDKTRVGAMVRAGMDNREIAATLGINNKLIFTGVFVLGSMIAGFSVMFGGSVTGLSSATSWNVLLNSIIVVVVGGTGSIQGALLGGIIIGLANAFGTVYLQQMTSFLIYIVLIVVLLIKPSGLMGRKVDVNKAIEADLEKTGAKGHADVLPKAEVIISKLKVSPKLRTYRLLPYALILIVLVICPMIVGTYTTSMLTKALIYALFAASLDIIMGYGGMRSFGHAAYFGVGGYIVGLFIKYTGINNFWLLLLLVIVICGLLGALLSYFTLKFSGTYFLIVTMAFGQILSVAATTFSSITGGSDGLNGIPRPDLGFVDIKWDQTKLFYLVLIVFVICFLIMKRIMSSSYGRSIVGVRENEGRMRALGYNTWSTKYMACILAGIFAGIAGMLYSYVYMAMVPSMLDLTTSAMPMLMVIMGGGATLWGPALGAFIIILFQNYSGIYFPDRWPLLLGLLYVACVLFLRGGISPYLTNFWNWVGSKLFPNGRGAAKNVTTVSAGEEMKK